MSSLMCVVTVPTENEERRLHAMTCACGGAAFVSEPKRSGRKRHSCFGSARKTVNDNCESNDAKLEREHSGNAIVGGSYGNVCQHYQQHRDGTHHWQYMCHSGVHASAEGGAALGSVPAHNNQNKAKRSHDRITFETPNELPKAEEPNNNDNNYNMSVELNITRCASLERVVREIICKLEIPGVFWSKDLEQRMLQARFTIALDEKYERLIATLHEWGIGERVGTSLSAINCLDTRSCTYPYKVRSCGIESAWNRFMDSVRCRLNVHQVVRQVRQDATVTFDFIVLLVSAAALACFGLVENSHLFLSSSMLISPLMGPIIAGVFGTVIKDYKLCWLGLRNEIFGIACATVVGLIFGIIVCFAGHFFVISSGLTQEILSRCETHALSVGIFTALASGAAGAIAVLGGNIGSVVGVAISASLLPPAVNSGLLWALALGTPFFSEQNEMMSNLVKQKIYSNHQSIELICYASISMLVTMLNIVCVWIMGVIVLRVKEIAPSIRKTNEKFWKHDIKIARQTGFDSETQNAIENYDGQKGCLPNSYIIDISNAQYQHTWSPANKSPEYEAVCQQRNYHTVHGFETICQAMQKSGKDSSGLPERESATPSIAIMELFAKGPLDVSPSTSYENSDFNRSKYDLPTETTITPRSYDDYDFCVQVADKGTQKRNYWSKVRKCLAHIRFLTFDVAVQTDVSYLEEYRKRMGYPEHPEQTSESTADRASRELSSDDMRVLYEPKITWSSEQSNAPIEELSMGKSRESIAEQLSEQTEDEKQLINMSDELRSEQLREQQRDVPKEQLGSEQPKGFSSPELASERAKEEQLSKSWFEPTIKKSRYEIVKVSSDYIIESQWEQFSEQSSEQSNEHWTQNQSLEESRVSLFDAAQAQPTDGVLRQPNEAHLMQLPEATIIAMDEDAADTKTKASPPPPALATVVTLDIGMSPTEPTQSATMDAQPTASELPAGSTQATQEKSTQSEVAVLQLKQDDDNKDDSSANEYEA